MNNGKSKARGGNVVSALCRILGIVFIVLVIATSLPLTVPRLMDYEIYNVESGSMEPEIPVGSVVYVKKTEPTDIKTDDVISYYREMAVVTHRVVLNKIVEGEFITKGDANNTEDLEPVPYHSLIGRVEKHFPVLGRMLVIYSSFLGKIYVLIFAGCGVLLSVLGSMLQRKE